MAWGFGCKSVKHSKLFPPRLGTSQTAAERRGHDVKGSKDFYLNARAKIWP